MKGILIDENLPVRIALPTTYPVEHVSSLGESPSDSTIWGHAKDNDLVIVTKDADFSVRVVIARPPPRVVHIRVGNMPLKSFVSFLERCWPQIELRLPAAKLINVYSDRIEVVE